MVICRRSRLFWKKGLFPERASRVTFCSIRKPWGIGERNSATNPGQNHSLNFLEEQEFTHPGFPAGFGLGMLREFLLIPGWSRSSASPRCPARLWGEFYIAKCFALKPDLKPALLQRLSGPCWKMQLSSTSARVKQEILGQECLWNSQPGINPHPN